MATIYITEHKVQVNGYYVHYQMAGRGDPIILVHGLSGSSRWWVRNVSGLAERYTVYLVDLPGFGAMHRSQKRFVLTEAAMWLVRWMEVIGLKRAHFVGHSMGGFICLRLAAQRPEAVRSLVLVSPAGIPRVRSLLGYLIPLLLAVCYITPSFLLILIYDALRAGPLRLLHAAQDLLTQDVRQDLKSITVPTLLIWGENDTLVPPVLGDILHKEILNSRLLILKKAAHVSMFERPQEFNAALLAFLEGKLVEK